MLWEKSSTEAGNMYIRTKISKDENSKTSASQSQSIVAEELKHTTVTVQETANRTLTIKSILPHTTKKAR